jgi:hypothetical protein
MVRQPAAVSPPPSAGSAQGNVNRAASHSIQVEAYLPPPGALTLLAQRVSFLLSARLWAATGPHRVSEIHRATLEVLRWTSAPFVLHIAPAKAVAEATAKTAHLAVQP